MQEVLPVYEVLVSLAANTPLVHNDDTYVRILELMGKRRSELIAQGALDLPDRTGLFTTGIVARTLVTQRMKQSGMRWGEDGGQAILTVRGWTQSSDRFDRAWAMLAATYRAKVVTLHNVLPFPPGGRQKLR